MVKWFIFNWYSELWYTENDPNYTALFWDLRDEKLRLTNFPIKSVIFIGTNEFFNRTESVIRQISFTKPDNKLDYYSAQYFSKYPALFLLFMTLRTYIKRKLVMIIIVQTRLACPWLYCRITSQYLFSQYRIHVWWWHCMSLA